MNGVFVNMHTDNKILEGHLNNFSTTQKKLMILPDKSSSVLSRSISSIQSPFKIKKQRHVSDPLQSPSKKMLRKQRHVSNTAPEEVILRSSELEPSVHQTTIPTANEVLIHARVCALMEGYDQLLEARAKAPSRRSDRPHEPIPKAHEEPTAGAPAVH